jgi:GT2 family glycosyltransferase
LGAFIRQVQWAHEQLKKRPSFSRVFAYLMFRGWHVVRQLKPYRYTAEFDRGALAAQIADLPARPSISVVLQSAGCTAIQRERCLDSIARQVYPPADICLTGDPQGETDFAAAAGLPITRQPRGDYCVFLMLGDQLCENALYEFALAIVRHNADFIYSDEDFLTEAHRLTRPHFKPDFSLAYLMGYHYIGNLVAAKTTLLREHCVTPDSPAFSNRYLRTLRLACHAQRVHHVAKVLCHTRIASLQDAASEQQALSQYLAEGDIPAEVTTTPEPHVFRVRYAIRQGARVSIMIPFRDGPALLERCVRSVLDKTDYRDYEILLVSNQSRQPETLHLLDEFDRQEARIRVLHYDAAFNFSLINNFASRSATGHHLLLLNNDTEVIEPGWLKAMLEYSQMEDIGCVGAKLLYKSNGAIQHAGMVLADNQVAHAHREVDGASPGYFNRLATPQNCMAVTGACLMVKKGVYERLGGLDERFAVEFNDVDFCLRVRSIGLQNVWTPFSVLYHDESASRGLDWQNRFSAQAAEELAYMRSRWGNALTHDPYYNENLKSLFRSPFSF